MKNITWEHYVALVKRTKENTLAESDLEAGFTLLNETIDYFNGSVKFPEDEMTGIPEELPEELRAQCECGHCRSSAPSAAPQSLMARMEEMAKAKSEKFIIVVPNGLAGDLYPAEDLFLADIDKFFWTSKIDEAVELDLVTARKIRGLIPGSVVGSKKQK